MDEKALTSPIVGTICGVVVVVVTEVLKWAIGRSVRARDERAELRAERDKERDLRRQAEADAVTAKKRTAELEVQLAEVEVKVRKQAAKELGDVLDELKKVREKLENEENANSLAKDFAKNREKILSDHEREVATLKASVAEKLDEITSLRELLRKHGVRTPAPARKRRRNVLD